MDLATYHGNINKQTCEHLLFKKGKDGSFLIRDSETIQGALCLCVYKQKIIYTYRILQTHTGQYTLQTSAGVQEKFFKTMEDLIKNYKKSGQGLATCLRHGVKRKGELPQKDIQDETPDYEEYLAADNMADLHNLHRCNGGGCGGLPYCLQPEVEESSDYINVLPS